MGGRAKRATPTFPEKLLFAKSKLFAKSGNEKNTFREKCKTLLFEILFAKSLLFAKSILFAKSVSEKYEYSGGGPTHALQPRILE